MTVGEDMGHVACGKENIVFEVAVDDNRSGLGKEVSVGAKVMGAWDGEDEMGAGKDDAAVGASVIGGGAGTDSVDGGGGGGDDGNDDDGGGEDDDDDGGGGDDDDDGGGGEDDDVDVSADKFLPRGLGLGLGRAALGTVAAVTSAVCTCAFSMPELAFFLLFPLSERSLRFLKRFTGTS